MQLGHPISLGSRGAWFLPLRELFDRQAAETRSRWDRLWMITGRGLTHPTVYQHPIRGEQGVFVGPRNIHDIVQKHNYWVCYWVHSD